MYYIFTSCKFWLLNVKFVFARETSRAFFFISFRPLLTSFFRPSELHPTPLSLKIIIMRFCVGQNSQEYLLLSIDQ
jgi:hypothetical protein